MNTVPRWLVAALAAAVLATAGGGTWFYHSQDQRLRENAAQNLESIARLKVDQVVAWRAQRLADVSVLMDSPFLTEAVAAWMEAPDATQTAKLSGRLRATRERYGYRDVLVTDPDGQVRLSLIGRTQPLPPETARAVEAALRDRKPVLTDLLAEGGSTPHLDAVAPLLAGDAASAKPVGAVVLQNDAQKFLNPLIQSWPVPSSTAETLLVRRDGDDVLFLNDLRHQADTALKLRIALTRTDVPAVMAVLGKEGVMQGRDYRGVEVLSVLKAIPDSPWFMVAKVDAAEAFVVWRFHSVLVLALIFGSLVVAASVVALAWQQNAKAHYYALLEAQAAQARLAAIVEASDDAIVGQALDGTITSWNKGAERLYGYAAEEAVGKPVSMLAAPGRTDEVTAILARVLGGERVSYFETERMTKAGARIFVSLSLSPAMDSQGNIVGASTIARDVTARKRAEEEIRRLNDELQQRASALEAANKELETFSYSASHDLRAPLRSLSGFSEAVAEDYAPMLDERGRDYLSRIRAASHQMGQLIDDMLELSRVGRSEMRPTRVDLSVLAERVAAELREADPQRQAEFAIRPGLIAEGDSRLLRVVLTNMLGNAWKFTGRQPVARIEFGATQVDGTSAYYVRDNGVGFDMAYAGKLFAPFQRLHAPGEFPGTGIGLATVARIVRRHGGRAWAEGAVGKGATFYFTLSDRKEVP